MSRRRFGVFAACVAAAVVLVGSPDGATRAHAAQKPDSAAAPTAAALTDAQIKAARTIMENPGFACFTCHTYKGKGGLPNVPTYDNVGMRRSPEWLAAWIRDPKAMKKDTIMPVFKQMTEKQIQTLVTFLSAQTHAVDGAAIVKAAKSPAEAGAKLVAEYDCQACHIIAKKGKSEAPDLSHIGKKYTAEQIATWITAPAKMKKDAWGPAYTVSAAEAAAMAAYLSSLK